MSGYSSWLIRTKNSVSLITNRSTRSRTKSCTSMITIRSTRSRTKSCTSMITIRSTRSRTKSCTSMITIRIVCFFLIRRIIYQIRDSPSSKTIFILMEIESSTSLEPNTLVILLSPYLYLSGFLFRFLLIMFDTVFVYLIFETSVTDSLPSAL